MRIKTFPEDFLTYLKQNTLAGVKGGLVRETFLNIWMVEVDGRVFARSWEKSSRSWFTAFQEQGTGQIKYGDKVMNVSGITNNDPDQNLLIDEAYRKKYTQEHNLFYVNGITQPEYRNYTMEFIFDSEL